MAAIPSDPTPIVASCPKCGLMFPVSRAGPAGIAIGLPGQSLQIGKMYSTGSGLMIEDSTASCPKCGTPGRIPDGLYTFVREGFTFARSLTPSEAVAVVQALRAYRGGDASEEEVVAAAPPASATFLVSLLTKLDKKFWAGILLALILALWAKADTSHISLEDAAIEQQLQQISEEEQAISSELSHLDPQADEESRAPSPAVRSPTPRAIPPETNLQPPSMLPAKNDPCWCGSGRRYHRCHRREAR
jgi:SEC-C motif